MTTNNRLAAVLTAAALALCGCATKPTQTETHFGASVREMIQAQTADPSTLTAPSTTAIESGDGQRLERVLEAYRTDVAKPESVKKDVIVGVGNGSR